MVLSIQQTAPLKSFFRVPGKQFYIIKNGEVIFPTNPTEIAVIEAILDAKEPNLDISFFGGRWYNCALGKSDPSFGQLIVLDDITEFMSSEIGLLKKESTKDFMIGYLQSLEITPQDFAFIMLDVDNFKVINDTYGHLAGDAVLSSIAGAIKGNLRKTDIIGRYGGDEMFILLKNISPELAQLKAEELRRSVESLKVTCSGIEISGLTISLGEYLVTPEEYNGLKSSISDTDQSIYSELLEVIIKAADSALLNSKSAGKNRFVIATSPEGEFVSHNLTRTLINKPHGRRSSDVQNA